MSRERKINEDIEACILEIEMHYPELYHLLEETPFRGMDSNKPISNDDLEDYLNSLRDQLRTFQNKELKNK